MGIGCVLLAWAIVGAVAAGGAACGLMLCVFLVRRFRPAVGRRWIVVAGALPFALLAYAGVAFGVYALWCENVRRVDPGIGDVWQVPLPNGWRFLMIDTPDSAMLVPPSGDNIAVDRARLGMRGDTILVADAGQFFAIDTKTRRRTEFASEEAMLRTFGSSRGELSDANWFYTRRRWTIADALAGVVIAAPAAMLLLAMAVRFLIVAARRRA
ncbi:MAG TPA: hypothetical protein VND45_12925 [Thermoanaerobaculia bacterium]|jgi:hypothetical protein|nr:hypothetical protein [Thermoanaerobaculia bacterium]